MNSASYRHPASEHTKQCKDSVRVDLLQRLKVKVHSVEDSKSAVHSQTATAAASGKTQTITDQTVSECSQNSHQTPQRMDSAPPKLHLPLKRSRSPVMWFLEMTFKNQLHPITYQPCIPPGSLNRVPASAGVRAGMSPLPGGR